MTESLKTARVIRVNRTNWEIKDVLSGSTVVGIINNRFSGASLPVVGDFVEYLPHEWDKNIIINLIPRKNTLLRKYNAKEQLMASNIDVVFIVSSMNQEFDINKIERLAIIGHIDGARLYFILTKEDLTDNPQGFVKFVKERFPRYEVITMDALHGKGIDKLKRVWKPGETAIFIGSSGVGKSTIINQVCGREVAKTGGIRESDDTGRHITTHRNMLFADDGRIVIDTPGIRTVQTSKEFSGAESVFSDIIMLEKKCKYSSCTHTPNSEGCAVVQAVKEGTVSDILYRRYLKLNKKTNNKRSIKKAHQLKNYQKERVQKNLKREAALKRKK